VLRVRPVASVIPACVAALARSAGWLDLRVCGPFLAVFGSVWPCAVATSLFGFGWVPYVAVTLAFEALLELASSIHAFWPQL